MYVPPPEIIKKKKRAIVPGALRPACSAASSPASSFVGTPSIAEVHVFACPVDVHEAKVQPVAPVVNVHEIPSTVQVYVHEDVQGEQSGVSVVDMNSAPVTVAHGDVNENVTVVDVHADAEMTSVVNSLCVDHSNLFKRFYISRAERESLFAEIDRLVANQNEFCESEKFEEADLIDEEIYKIKVKLVELDEELFVEIPEEMSLLENELESMLANRKLRLTEERALVESEYFFQKESLDLKKCEIERKLIVSKKIDQQFLSEDAAIQRDVDSLAAQSAELDEAMATESGEIEAEKSLAESEYTRLDLEIAELQNLLQIAMEKRSECAKCISSTSMKLGNIRAQFSDEIETLDFEKKRIEILQTDLDTKKSQLGGGVCQDLTVQMSDLVDSLTQLESLYKSEIANFSYKLENWTKFSILKKIPVFPPNMVSSYLETSKLVNQLYTSLRELEVRLEDSKSSNKLEKLEADKKTAILNRAFKEAKEISEQIKFILENNSAENLRTQIANVRSSWIAASKLQQELQAHFTLEPLHEEAHAESANDKHEHVPSEKPSQDEAESVLREDAPLERISQDEVSNGSREDASVEHASHEKVENWTHEDVSFEHLLQNKSACIPHEDSPSEKPSQDEAANDTHEGAPSEMPSQDEAANKTHEDVPLGHMSRDEAACVKHEEVLQEKSSQDEAANIRHEDVDACSGDALANGVHENSTVAPLCEKVVYPIEPPEQCSM